MSEQDKATIVGNLVLEAGQVRRDIEFTRNELNLVATDLDALLSSIRPRTHGISQNPPVPMKLGAYVQKYADLSKLVALVDEQDALLKKAADLGQRLTELGA